MFGEAFDLTFAQVVVLFPKPYQTRGGKTGSGRITKQGKFPSHEICTLSPTKYTEYQGLMKHLLGTWHGGRCIPGPLAAYNQAEEPRQAQIKTMDAA
ncbi:Fibrocystin-L [Manis pentadactyla]|nr:Fibrocystin-L [Manis pentadactyla]